MNYSEMSNSELLQEVKCCIVDHVNFNGFSEILKRIKGHQLTADEFAEAQRQGYDIVWPDMLASYKAGTAFGHQGLDFLSALMLTKEEVASDQERLGDFKGAKQALGSKPELEEILAFGTSRIEPSFEDRRKFFRSGGELMDADEMGPKLRIEFERRRDAYGAATVKWGWPGPFDPITGGINAKQ